MTPVKQAREQANRPSTYLSYSCDCPDMEAIVEIKTEFESYRLGTDDIDEQHHALFDYVENLDAAIASGDRWVVVYQTLVEIEHWAKVHFMVEESLMRICRYPHLEGHIQQHAIFATKVGQIKQQALTKDISREASEFLRT
jgi:hemerythrin-like metal-binding protein